MLMLLQINQKIQLIQASNFMDDTPEGLRSPSPEPVYNEHGQRANTREQRVKDKLMKERTVSVQCSSMQKLLHPGCAANACAHRQALSLALAARTHPGSSSIALPASLHHL